MYLDLISVVVPIYNVKDYLEKSVDSIINQNYSNLEIILVDDGSTDGSGELAKKIKNNDSRINVIQKENGGLSSARNAGIGIATGKYICFIDSDDWIEEDYIELLLSGLKSTNSDISVIQMKKEAHFETINYSSETKKDWYVYDRRSAMEVLFTNNDIGYSANNKLYKRSLFEGIEYPYGMLMEDMATTYRLIDNSEKVCVNFSKKYHYYQREGSILNSVFTEKQFDSFDIQERIVGFIDHNYPELSVKIRTRYVYSAIRMLMMMMRSNYQNYQSYKRCTDIIIKYQKEVKEDQDLSSFIKHLSVMLAKYPKLPYLFSNSRITASFLKKLELRGR